MPTDVKALLVAATLHMMGHVVLRAIVANGGCQATERAVLGLAILEALGIEDVPVGVGSDGKQVRCACMRARAVREPRVHAPNLHHVHAESLHVQPPRLILRHAPCAPPHAERATARARAPQYDAQPHEFRLDGFDRVDRTRLWDGAELLRSLVLGAEPRSLTIVCISSLRDFADLIAGFPDEVGSAVGEVAIQAGLEAADGAARPRARAGATVSPDGAHGPAAAPARAEAQPWVPDTR